MEGLVERWKGDAMQGRVNAGSKISFDIVMGGWVCGGVGEVLPLSFWVSFDIIF